MNNYKNPQQRKNTATVNPNKKEKSHYADSKMENNSGKVFETNMNNYKNPQQRKNTAAVNPNKKEKSHYADSKMENNSGKVFETNMNNYKNPQQRKKTAAGNPNKKEKSHYVDSKVENNSGKVFEINMNNYKNPQQRKEMAAVNPNKKEKSQYVDSKMENNSGKVKTIYNYTPSLQNLHETLPKTTYFPNPVSDNIAHARSNQQNLNVVDHQLLYPAFNPLLNVPGQVNKPSNRYCSSKNYDGIEPLFPADGYEKSILTSLMNNQITIVSADVYYSMSEIIPSFVHNLHLNNMILCCEPNAATAAAVAERCSIFIYNKFIPGWISFETEENSNKGPNTKILFMSVQKLFSESLHDPLLSNYKFIIFHCDIRRNVETDFLLERLRKCISCRADMRMILLLSVLDNASKFEKYFSICASIGTLVASSDAFPVKTIWKKASFSADKNYINEVIDTALAILTLNKPGNILVFLPTLFDIAKTLRLLSIKLKEYSFHGITCIPLYEDSTEQSDLCYQLPKVQTSKYKIFLTTSWAELLVMPSVKYIIDTGIRRDLHYDQIKSSDSVAPMFISRARAKLRKHYIGYLDSGTCYRLYSKEDYSKKMIPCETPEILLKNPVDVMIKTFFFSKDDTFTDFIETLPEERKERAVNILNNANIIQDDHLTNLGLLINKLPYSHKYSKLIIIGSQWGYVFESIVLVAFFLLKSTIFIYEEDNIELQKRVDATKLQYICHNSDTLTNLNIYFDWLLDDRDQFWCINKALNLNMLKKVQSVAKSIGLVVSKKLKQDLSMNPDRDWSVLQEMLFECFKENLCIYTGNFRSGYQSLSSEGITFLHPSSSILEKSNLPEFVVYDHLKLTSRDFMMGVTSVPESLVLPALEKGALKDKSHLLGQKLKSVVIENVGIMVIKHGLLGKKGRKLLDIENQIKKDTKCDLLVIEPSEEKGNVTLYAPPEHIDEIEAVIRTMLKRKLESILNDEETVMFELVKEPFKIPINITLKKGAVAIKVEIKPEVQDKIKSKQVNSQKLGMKSSINLVWKRRDCRGVGYASFDDSRSFSVARRLCTKTINVMGKNACVALDTKHSNQLYISGLLAETTNEKLEEAVNKALKEQLLSNIKVKTAFLAYKAAFETTESDCEIVRKKLLVACSTLLHIKDIDVVVPKPENTAGIMKAFVNFASTVDETNAKVLNEQLKIDDLSIKAQPVYYSTIMCSSNIFTVLQEEIDSELYMLKQKLKSVLNVSTDSIFKYSGDMQAGSSFVCLKLLANRIDILNILQRKFHKLLEGQILTRKTFSNLHQVFTYGGHLWLKSLQKEVNVCIIEEYKTTTLRLYGSTRSCSLAYQKINRFLNDVKNEIVKTMDLSSGKHFCTLMKTVISRYGVDLKKFIEIFSLRSAEINIRTSQLIFRGCSRSIEKATMELEHLVKLCSRNTEGLESCQESCCLCDMPPLVQSVRLEHCGHLYCTECVKGLIVTADFPIQCCAQDCDKDILLEDIRKGLDYEDKEIDQLMSRCLADFVFRNSQYLIQCPTPDCSFFFDNREVTEKKWTCDLCQNEICISCNVVFHQGYTCEMYKKSESDPDYSLKLWLNENRSLRKMCPTCKAAIEKNGGCNHMTCTFCNAHFCWLCETAFPNAELVYNHQSKCPKRYT